MSASAARAYYNENDPKTGAWLRELIKAGLIAEGEVDDRSIVDVQPEDLRGFAQCHFFAGVGGWSYALRLAGWADDRPIWTGSCPCQPFSQAGHGRGKDDARHLWPEFYRLISQCRPAVVFGEQVASKAGRAWLSAVCADLEALAYRRAAADLCAAGVGAPHIRQRLYWVADCDGSRCGAWRTGEESDRRDSTRKQSARFRDVGNGLADTDGSERAAWFDEPCRTATARSKRVTSTSLLSRMGDTSSERLQERVSLGRLQSEAMEPHEREATERRGNPERMADAMPTGRTERWPESRDGSTTGSGSNHWSACDWLPCLDGKSRPVESGTFPLAHGVPARVGRLRGYGNAIVPQVAAEFIGAYRDAVGY